MKREEQMMKSAEKYADEICGEGYSQDKILAMNFYAAGWQEADQHHHWISVEDELPEKDNEFEDYSKLVVVTDGKDFYKGMYNYGGECWLTHNLWPIEDATYWMEVQIPQSPRKEDKE